MFGFMILGVSRCPSYIPNDLAASMLFFSRKAGLNLPVDSLCNSFDPTVSSHRMKQKPVEKPRNHNDLGGWCCDAQNLLFLVSVQTFQKYVLPFNLNDFVGSGRARRLVAVHIVKFESCV